MEIFTFRNKFLFYAIKIQENWNLLKIFSGPSEINFTKVFASASDYYDKMWSSKHKNYVIGSRLGQVIIFLATRVRFTTPIEQESILESLKKLKEKYPGLHFVYYVSVDNAPLFEPFLLSANDHLVKESRIKDALLNGTHAILSSIRFFFLIGTLNFFCSFQSLETRALQSKRTERYKRSDWGLRESSRVDRLPIRSALARKHWKLNSHGELLQSYIYNSNILKSWNSKFINFESCKIQNS